MALLAGCATTPTPTPIASAELLAAPDRLAGNNAKDIPRKTAQSLNFMQLQPGQTVFEIEAGGGYGTELFSRADGPGGKVIMQNPAGFMAEVKATLDKRFTGGRLANVAQNAS